ncbi:hypothetical protein Btru_022804 [Bulinus truncatus]|nr:hypothetical protein Btru_022804 [Bulinus truncatus]
MKCLLSSGINNGSKVLGRHLLEIRRIAPGCRAGIELRATERYLVTVYMVYSQANECLNFSSKTMETVDSADVVVKKEPVDNVCDETDNGVGQSQTSSESTNSVSQGRLRYVSRRGRPPGGGYSMKTHATFSGFNSAAGDLSHHAVSSLSTHDLLKNSVGADGGLDMRRFGFHGFEGDKSSFRCDGCDVVFSSRDTYAMHMLLRAKNESCVALPSSAISPNPENPTPREKFERELRQQAMLMALRSQAAVMTKAATAATLMPKSGLADGLQPLTSPTLSSKEEMELSNGNTLAERALNFGSLFSVDAFGVYVDPKQYRRFLAEYGLRTSASSASLVTMLEQMTCGLCGEMFSNKDALAMHVMYHTRDEDNENSSGALWSDMSANMPRGHVFPNSSNSSSPTSPALGVSSSSTAKSGACEEKRGKNAQSQDRELTAERVAELKRMAIESSLRSPSKKCASSVRTLARPKSVSQDAAVAASAQTRPLSADDAMMLTNGSSKNNDDEDSQYRNQKKMYDSGIQRKRPADDTLDDSISGEVSSESDSTKRKILREDKKELLGSKTPVGFDDSNTQEVKTDSDSNNMVRSITYLDAITAQEAVLVPIETLDPDEEGNNTKDDVGEESSALDFSIGGRGRADSSSMLSWYSAPAATNDPDTRQRETNGVKEQSERRSAHHSRGLFYHSTTSDTPDNSRSSHGHYSGLNGTSFSSRSNRMGCDYQNERSARGPRGDSPGRAGEARYCPHCEILFLDVTLFHLHMGLHNVNNPWQCNTCGLVCSGRLDFNTHVLHF